MLNYIWINISYKKYFYHFLSVINDVGNVIMTDKN